MPRKRLQAIELGDLGAATGGGRVKSAFEAASFVEELVKNPKRLQQVRAFWGRTENLIEEYANMPNKIIGESLEGELLVGRATMH